MDIKGRQPLPNKDNNASQESRRLDKDNGKLNLIRKRLYAREESEDIQRRKEELHRLGITRRPPGDLEKKSDTLAASRFKNVAALRARRWGRVVRFMGAWFVVLMIVFAVVAVAVWYRSTQTVTEAQMLLLIEAPQEFVSGEEIIYRMRIGNGSRVDWQSVELVLTPSRGFNFRGSNQEVEATGKQFVWRVGNLASGESVELHVRGQLIGEQNETAVAEAELLLTPENFPSGRFRRSELLATTITGLPFDISPRIPKEAASGERLVASIGVRNLSNHVLENVYLRLVPGEGVQLAAEDTEFSPGFSPLDSQWQLARLNPLESREFTVVLYIEGQSGQQRTLNIAAGIHQDGEDFTQRELTHAITLAAAKVFIEQLFNDSSGPFMVQAGETVSGQVRYSNTGTIGLQDVIITVKFEGAGFDPRSLELKGGAYDPTERTITWSAATVPALKLVQPQQDGEVSFGFTVLSTEEFLAAAGEGRNRVLVTTATIDSPDDQAVSDRAVLSVRTDLAMAAVALYDEGGLGLTSSGPVPPRVGETTTYTLRFRIGSSLNDVGDVRLVAVLPDGVSYTGQLFKTKGEMMFNERTGEIVWTLPLLEALVGYTKPPEELHMQVSITPGEDKRGSAVQLVNRVSLAGTDQFTDQTVTASVEDFASTETAVRGKGQVE